MTYSSVTVFNCLSVAADLFLAGKRITALLSTYRNRIILGNWSYD